MSFPQSSSHLSEIKVKSVPEEKPLGPYGVKDTAPVHLNISPPPIKMLLKEDSSELQLRLESEAAIPSDYCSMTQHQTFSLTRKPIALKQSTNDFRDPKDLEFQEFKEGELQNYKLLSGRGITNEDQDQNPYTQNIIKIDQGYKFGPIQKPRHPSQNKERKEAKAERDFSPL